MGTNYSPRIVTDGLVLCLDAANPKSYSGSGTTWKDLSGNGNDGTLVNGVGYESNSFIFDGINEGINCGNVDLSSTFSISVWFKGNPIQNSSFCGISCKDGGGNFGDGGLYADSNNNYIRFGFLDSNGSQREISNSNYHDLRSTNWVNYVGTYDQVNLKLYRNSTLISSNNFTQTPISSNNSYSVAYRPQSGSYYFMGSISNTCVYNRALTESEVQQNYNALKGRFNL